MNYAEEFESALKCTTKAERYLAGENINGAGRRMGNLSEAERVVRRSRLHWLVTTMRDAENRLLFGEDTHFRRLGLLRDCYPSRLRTWKKLGKAK